MLLYRKINRGGQFNETASVKDKLTEVVALRRTTSVNVLLTKAVGLGCPPQLMC